MIKRKTQLILWVIATIIGVVAVYNIARSIVIGTSATIGVSLLALTLIVLTITLSLKPRRDGDTQG